jgi:hypothetical protein
MHQRQHGTLNLYWLAIFSAVFAAAAMAALFSMRYERNLFAEGWAKVVGAAQTPALETARQAVSGAVGAPQPPSNVLRKCIIDGKKVISNVDCLPENKTSQVIEIHDTKGFEAPKVPVRAEPEPSSDPMIDKAIEKQMR